jgi:pentapeptide MXKDX repeat protein
MVFTNIVKHFVSLVVLLFFTYLIGAKLFDRFWLNPGSLREGLEDDMAEDDIAEDDMAEDDMAEDDMAEDDMAEDDMAEDDMAEDDEDDATEEPTIAKTCKIPEASKSIELAAAFEKVGKQTDMLRSIRESTTPAVPIKIDKDADPNFLILANLKLLMNNGISVNETTLKYIYDQYIGNREVTFLANELNLLTFDSESSEENLSKEEDFLCRVKIIIEGHQTIIDSILEKRANE